MGEVNLFISSNIRYLRGKYNKKQSEIAKVCGKKNTAVSNWEKGIRQPDAADIGKLANYFDISVGELLLDDLRFKDNKLSELDNVIIQKVKLLTEEDKQALITMINALIRNNTK